MGYVRNIFGGLFSLLSGMSITIRAMVQKPVTQEYPHVEPELSKAYRSAIKLVHFEETQTHDCIACLLCEKICPSFCIKIDGYKPDGIKRKRATVFDMDFALCSLCGLCLDVCPTDTLEYSSLYDLTGYERDVFNFDLLDPFRDGEDAYLGRARLEQAAKDAEKERLRQEKLATKNSAAAEAPAQDAPAAEAPAAEAPAAEAPTAEAPAAEAPAAEAPAADVPAPEAAAAGEDENTVNEEVPPLSDE